MYQNKQNDQIKTNSTFFLEAERRRISYYWCLLDMSSTVAEIQTNFLFPFIRLNNWTSYSLRKNQYVILETAILWLKLLKLCQEAKQNRETLSVSQMWKNPIFSRKPLILGRKTREKYFSFWQMWNGFVSQVVKWRKFHRNRGYMEGWQVWNTFVSS